MDLKILILRKWFTKSQNLTKNKEYGTVNRIMNYLFGKMMGSQKIWLVLESKVK